ncbi:ABC-F family ATP-binding cassette domain-containing protein, partial [Nocardioides sp.]|uniref:ABC-F family ATP-binding cassette domain-containing protein n=1 Tax=Nocardioides sp. TaxID=35761 RepID=UPI0027343CE6
MITAQQLEIRAGARLLMENVSFRVAAGDKVGLVGRNGAGKTTLTKILAGEALPASGKVTATGEVGYLPQDPRIGDPEVLARDRILSARGLDDVVRRLRTAESDMGSSDSEVAEKAMRQYTRADNELHAGGGYAAESEAAQIAGSLGIEERILSQPLKTLSGGQRRRVELARILFSGAETLLLDEPTNHLDADSIVWLRGFLQSHPGGLIVISHDNDLLGATVNRVLHLDANRAEMDVYNMGWRAYLTQRETDERRRKKERANAESKAKTLTDQANRMRAKASKATAAQSMLKRAEKMMAGLEGERQADKVARIKFPAPAPCGKTPITAEELSKSYGSLEVFTDVDLAIDRGSRVVILGLNGAGKTTMLRILAGVDQPDTGRVVPGHGLKVGYYAQEHETLDTGRTVLENMQSAAPQLTDSEARSVLGSFLFSGDDAHKSAAVLSGGEKTRLALA